MEKSLNFILPALAVRKEALIPNNEIRIEVGREISLNALNLSESKFDSSIILLIQKDPLIEDVTSEDVLPFLRIHQQVKHLQR